MEPRCSFCGHAEAHSPGGLFGRDPYICRYCARRAIRAIGDINEVPDTNSEPVDFHAWRQAREAAR